jgi:hypothetical protein
MTFLHTQNSVSRKKMRNSAELYKIPWHGILYNSAEFSLIPYSIWNGSKCKKVRNFALTEFCKLPRKRAPEFCWNNIFNCILSINIFGIRIFGLVFFKENMHLTCLITLKIKNDLFCLWKSVLLIPTIFDRIRIRLLKTSGSRSASHPDLKNFLTMFILENFFLNLL